MRFQSIALYQPEALIIARLPGGARELFWYIESVQRELARHYASGLAEPTSRALVVALHPDGCAFWLLTPEGSADDQPTVRGLLVAVPLPGVVDGPIAFALLCNLGADFPTAGGPPVPDEWRQITRNARQSLTIDDILSQLRSS